MHSGTVATTRTRGFDHPAYNVIRIDERRIRVDLRVPGGDEHTLGIYPRTWAPALATPQAGVFVPLPLRSGLPIAADGLHG